MMRGVEDENERTNELTPLEEYKARDCSTVTVPKPSFSFKRGNAKLLVVVEMKLLRT
jgi:hypothetical protein